MATKSTNQSTQKTQTKPAIPSDAAQAGQPDLKRKLAWRMGFAGLMIVLLLGSLALFDYLSAPDEQESQTPRFTEPVPVPRKEITQPVKQAEPVPEVIKEEAKIAVPEATTLPEPPARPVVDPQPTLPRAQSSGTSRPIPFTRPQPAGQQAAPATSYRTAPATSSPPSTPAQPAEARQPVESEPSLPVQRQPVAPAGGSGGSGGNTLGGRLFSGYALQAGVFSDMRLAEELHAKLTLNGIPSSFEARVQVGPFKTREEADAAREKMKALGIDAVMLMPPKGAVRR